MNISDIVVDEWMRKMDDEKMSKRRRRMMTDDRKPEKLGIYFTARWRPIGERREKLTGWICWQTEVSKYVNDTSRVPDGAEVKVIEKIESSACQLRVAHMFWDVAEKRDECK